MEPSNLEMARHIAAVMTEGTRSLPYREMVVPRFKPGVNGRWTLKRHHLTVMRGYFRGLQQLAHDNWVLLEHPRLTKTPKTWMSLTPMELESMMPAVHAATGKVVIGGLGMGVVALNCALKPEVEKVVILENNPRVYRLFHQFTDMRPFPEWAKKVSIRMGDATKTEPLGFEPDLLYVDIWETLGEKNAEALTRAVWERVGGKKVGWWGQELDAVDWMQAHGHSFPSTREAVEGWIAATGMPTIGLETDQYPAMIDQAVLNVVQYQ